MTTYDKLVRDRIPELIAAEGRHPVVVVLPSSERAQALITKLGEEAAEVAAADAADLPEELADVLEVVRALARGAGLSLDDVVALADRKREARGGFEQGLFLIRVEAADEPRG